MISQNAYLEIAELVLRNARRPMSAKDILRTAFLMGVVPAHLHGRTQHKTLTARLSIDILKLKQKSRFFRPWPGRFFLNQFLDDGSLPLEYRLPIVARRRARELKREYSAYINENELVEYRERSILPRDFRHFIDNSMIGYSQRGEFVEGQIPIWTFAVVARKREVLTFKKGKYRDGRENFSGLRSIGFSAPLTHDDYTLFDRKDHGACSSAITTLAADLDLEYSPALTEFETNSKFIGCCLYHNGPTKAVLAIVKINASADFSAYSKRLAINDLSWQKLDLLGRTVAQLDPWSQSVLNRLLG